MQECPNSSFYNPSLNSSGKIKALNLEFCSIKQFFIRDVHAKFSILNSPKSSYIEQNSAGGILNFRISGHICHNSRNSLTREIERRQKTHKNPDFSKIKSFLILHNIFPKTLSVFVITYKTSSF